MKSNVMNSTPSLNPLEAICLFLIPYLYTGLSHLGIKLPMLGDIQGFGITFGTGIMQGAGAMLGGLVLKMGWKYIGEWWKTRKSKPKKYGSNSRR